MTEVPENLRLPKSSVCRPACSSQSLVFPCVKCHLVISIFKGLLLFCVICRINRSDENKNKDLRPIMVIVRRNVMQNDLRNRKHLDIDRAFL